MLLLPPRSTFYVAAPLAFSAIFAVVLAMPQAPKSAPAHVPEPARFDERWEQPALKKQDRLPLLRLPVMEPTPLPAQEPDPIPKPAQTEPVVMLAQAQQIETKPATPKRKSARDGVCRRGKVWRVTRHGWKSWRCRR